VAELVIGDNAVINSMWGYTESLTFQDSHFRNGTGAPSNPSRILAVQGARVSCGVSCDVGLAHQAARGGRSVTCGGNGKRGCCAQLHIICYAKSRPTSVAEHGSVEIVVTLW
jgi:hypothetical protein